MEKPAAALAGHLDSRGTFTRGARVGWQVLGAKPAAQGPTTMWRGRRGGGGGSPGVVASACCGQRAHNGGPRGPETGAGQR